jgi:hypothetical protein
MRVMHHREIDDPQLLQEAPFVKNGQRGVDICKVDFQKLLLCCNIW